MIEPIETIELFRDVAEPFGPQPEVLPQATLEAGQKLHALLYDFRHAFPEVRVESRTYGYEGDGDTEQSVQLPPVDGHSIQVWTQECSYTAWQTYQIQVRACPENPDLDDSPTEYVRYVLTPEKVIKEWSLSTGAGQADAKPEDLQQLRERLLPDQLAKQSDSEFSD